MNLIDAQRLATDLMRHHGLIPRWRFEWDNARKRFGACHHGPAKITLSRSLVALNSEDQVRDTILHEIAHALVGARHGHDTTWKLKCIEVGARPVRCYDSSKVVQPAGRWTASCPVCDYTLTRDHKAEGMYHIRCAKARQPLVWHRTVAGTVRTTGAVAAQLPSALPPIRNTVQPALF